ncbi:phosphopantetheine-binding protein, partial [Streptomyces sp. SPB074]|uniref:phosphopantetheine-binding protein n=1 Tax=Streptomyces sp. (strain SPB074) TaxID=465543 RepID=UPI001319C096
METHGTGTRLGDPIEAEGLKDAFTRLYAERGEALPAEPHITLGSVKTNIGHLEAAAGIAGLLKVLLALRHRTLPAHLHLRETNPYLRLDGTPFRIGTTTTPWEGAKDEHGRTTWRAGISSFGFGGTNAHVVLEAWTPPDDTLRPDVPARQRPRAEFQPRRHWFTTPRPAKTEPPVPHPDHAATSTHPQPDTTPAPRQDTAPRRQPRPAPDAVRPAATRPRVRLNPLATTPPDVPGEPAAPARGPAASPARDGGARRASGEPATGVTREAAPALGARPAVGADARPAATGDSRPTGAEIRATLRDMVAAVLGLTAADLPDDTPFADLGLDSIYRMDVARALNEAHGLDLQGAELYDHDTIAALADHVRAALGTRPPAPSPLANPAAPLRDQAEAPRNQAAPSPSQEAPSPNPPAPPSHETAPRATGEEPPADGGASQREERQERAEREGPVGRDDAREALRRVLEGVVGRPLDPAVTFADNGFTSFDMLRGVSALETDLGALPKALFFERPTLDGLTEALCETHGARTVARVRPPARQPAPALPVPPAARDTAARTRVLTRAEAAADPELAATVAELERRHGKESGLGGRDIAPYLFFGARRRGFFALSQRDGALLVWNYTGPEDHFAELAADYFDHARRGGLRPNLLSLVPLTEVGGEPVTATPFGALQRLEDLGSFTLSGGRMSRLRYMVKRFEKAGACRTSEYRSGEDPAVDAELASLVDEWAATKQMVNPYVRRVREELAGGRLDARHRLFLTYVDETLVNAVVITRIPSENGYLLDVEFYPGHMPLGGLEFALVRVLERLREEGCGTFSFGASFGGATGTSSHASETAVRALEELREAGIFGGGNYQFKNKFRPQNRTLYLVQPARGEVSEVSDVILMIADPGTPATPAPEAPAPAPETAATPETAPAPRPASAPAPAPESASRRSRLAAHGHNPARLPHLAVELDLLTDSWADRADPWQRARAGALAELADARGLLGEEPPHVPWLPFPHRFFAASGRAAEERLCRAWPGPHGRVLHASAFPTWLGALAEHGFDPSLALPVAGRGS